MLARHLPWSEQELLGLPTRRRKQYLDELIRQVTPKK